ncbi:MAG: molybdopterin-dependent oxidoreductase [Candidatus Krumholzibacteriia bacterium]
MQQTLRTACNRDCPDACGIVARVEDGRVVSLAGDRQHPITRGFLCERTARYLRRQYDADRLTHPLKRRGGRFVRVGWDEALDCVASGLARIRHESGPQAVLHYRSGGSLGILKVLNDYFFECFGGARVKKGDICSGAGEAAQEADMGTSDSGDLEDLVNSRCILLWGKNVTTSFVHMLPVLKEARRRGAVVVLLDPAPGRTARFADLVVRPRPGTDRFLALGMVRLLRERGAVDPTLSEWSVGPEEFLGLAMSRGLDDWARASDVRPEEIERLVDLYVSHRPANIQVGWGLQRRRFGGKTVRVLDALCAVSGNLGIAGGGVTFYSRRRRAFDTARYGPPESRRGIPEPLLGQGILDAKEPRVRSVVVDNGNPVAMLPDSRTVARALETRELVVVLEQFMTDTAERAHVVLPVTTMLEEEDVLGAFGHHHLIAVRPVARRPEQVKTDLEIYQALAARLGFGAELAGSAPEWAERLLAPVRGRVRYAALREGAVRNPLAAGVIFAARRFPTADGRFHFVTEVPLEEHAQDAAHPLSLGSFSSPRAQSSQWSRPIAGRPLEARCHPEAAPWATDGAPALLRSRIGHLQVVVRFDPGLRRDVVLVPKGGWLKHGQAANSLVRAEATDMGLGAAYYDEPVRLEPGHFAQ